MIGQAATPQTARAEPSATAEPAVVLRDVFCVHRTGQGDAAALQGLTLAVATGERLCVLGPSGAGKTTLLRVIAGLQRPSAGAVRVFGTDVGRLSTRAAARLRHAAVGVLHQRAEAALSPELPIVEAVALPLALRGARRDQRRRRAHELLSAAGLADRAGALPGELSGGERQRVAACAALAHRPRLLLADEPTAELDSAAAGALATLIDELAVREGTTVIAVSHDPELARRSPRTVGLRDGRLVADGEALVVAPGGWVRLGDERSRSAGLGGRVHARTTAHGLLLSPAGAPPDPEPVVPVPAAAVTGSAHPPVSVAAAAGSAHPPVSVAARSVTRTRGGRTVLRELSMDFAPARMTVVVGRSGAGKTTLLELLAGLADPDGGEIRLDGHSLAHGDERRAALRRALIGYLPQEPVPVGFLSAAENVAMALAMRDVSRERAATAAREVLAAVGLAERAGQRVARLSAGEAQRVALARALACARGLLIVDEPTSRLDEGSAAAMAKLLAQAAERDGQTVICASHDPQVIAHAHATVRLD